MAAVVAWFPPLCRKATLGLFSGTGTENNPRYHFSGKCKGPKQDWLLSKDLFLYFYTNILIRMLIFVTVDCNSVWKFHRSVSARSTAIFGCCWLTIFGRKLNKMSSEEPQQPSQSALSASLTTCSQSSVLAPPPAHSETSAPTESDDTDDLMLR